MDTRNAFFDEFCDRHWAVSDQLIDEKLADALYGSCVAAWQAHRFQPARIGREHSASLRADIRGDAILWLPDRPDDRAVKDFLDWADALRMDMNRLFYAGLHSAEFHFARYPEGSRYRKHLDQHQGSTQRKISLVLYLNPDWEDKDGGHLCMYAPGEDQREIGRILPRAGRLVAFRSDLFPHEVLPCRRPRYSLTGWFRTDGAA